MSSDDEYFVDELDEKEDNELLIQHVDLDTALKNIKMDIQELSLQLEVPAKRPLPDLNDLDKEGWIYRSIPGKSKGWKRCYAVMNGDRIFFFQEGPGTNVKTEAKICYYGKESVEQEDSLTKQYVKEGLSCKVRIKLITPGLLIEISFESDRDGDEWNRYLHKMVRKKYTKREINSKQEAIKQLLPLFNAQKDLIVEKFELILRALEESGFFIETNQKKKG